MRKLKVEKEKYDVKLKIANMHHIKPLEASTHICELCCIADIVAVQIE